MTFINKTYDGNENDKLMQQILDNGLHFRYVRFPGKCVFIYRGKRQGRNRLKARKSFQSIACVLLIREKNYRLFSYSSLIHQV